MLRTMTLGLLIFLAGVAMPAAAAATTNNDDSCDIGFFPAATLLLPYFEVDLVGTNGETTIFTVTNTSPQPQATRVTLWTDFAYPVISFNLYLTGYDVQKINLYDVVVRGLIAPDEEMGSDSSPVGELSDDDNQRLNEATCDQLPGPIPAIYLQQMQSAFTTGKVPELAGRPACNTAGGVHTNAVGYATIDVVGACTGSLPVDTGYFTHEIRFDNVLMGDYIQVNPTMNYAQGGPMVHIRAIPEGGEASGRRKTHLQRTFYSRLQPASNNTLDARQPLPSTFGARWIAGSKDGFETEFKIWREAHITSSAACSGYRQVGFMPIQAVRFDEEENPETGFCEIFCDPPIERDPQLPATALVSSENNAVFPGETQGAVAGWMFLDLNNRADANVTSQNWVVTSLRAGERFSVDIDATAFGNGCSPVRNKTDGIGPAPNTTP